MFRYSLIVFICGCAVGSTDSTSLDMTDNVNQTTQPDSGAEDLRPMDDVCTPIPNGPICEFYYSRNPYPYYGPLDQYSIECERYRTDWDWNKCLDFSYDDLLYSHDTWALCCPHKDAPVIK